MRGLTERQLSILKFIQDSIRDRGYPPTLREIGERFGIRSTNGVNDHLLALERKGYIERDDERARGVRVVDAATREVLESPTPPRSPGFPRVTSYRIRELRDARAKLAEQIRLIDRAIEIEERLIVGQRAIERRSVIEPVDVPVEHAQDAASSTELEPAS